MNVTNMIIAINPRKPQLINAVFEIAKPTAIAIVLNAVIVETISPSYFLIIFLIPIIF